MELTENNISTIATWLAILILPLAIQYGIDIDQPTLTAIISTIIVLIIAIWSSKNPNTIKILGNQPTPVESTEPILNPEYECDTNE